MKNGLTGGLLEITQPFCEKNLLKNFFRDFLLENKAKGTSLNYFPNEELQSVVHPEVSYIDLRSQGHRCTCRTGHRCTCRALFKMVPLGNLQAPVQNGTTREPAEPCSKWYHSGTCRPLFKMVPLGNLQAPVQNGSTREPAEPLFKMVPLRDLQNYIHTVHRSMINTDNSG